MTDQVCTRFSWPCLVAIGALAIALTTPAAADTALLEDDLQTELDADAWHASARLIQGGERLVLLGVTADNHALYQDGQMVYASALKHGAQKQLIGTSPPGVVSFVYTVGNVAFVWTRPDRSLPGFGVSPLTVWSAASGAHVASDSSPIGTFTTSASADGRHVMYTTRGTADGSVGDIEFANIQMTQRKTLVAAAPMSFPFGACRPWGSFVGSGQRSHPVVLFCEGGATAATLASWSSAGDSRKTLLVGALTQPYFTASPNGKQFFTALAGARTPVVVDDQGALRRLEEGVLSRRGFFIGNNEVFYSAFVSLAQPGEIHRASLRTGATSFVADHLAVFLTNQAGSDLIVTPPASPDGRSMAYTTGFDAATGLSDIRLADLAGSGSRVLEADKRVTLTGPLFSSNSKHVVYGRVDDSNTGNVQLIATGPQGRVLVGAASAYAHDRLAAGRIAFNDNVVFDNNDFFSSTADLKVVNLSRPSQGPRTVNTQAYLAFLPAYEGKALAYTTGRGSSGAGLYLATARE
jgi:hypothetical protein